tara:strand:- start:148 stop:570 length:423 start_codon:yes stop_codon:yes gene_type:complete
MFGNCVWAQLSSNHNINQNIYNFNKLFYYPNFKAHLTLNYGLKKKFNRKDYKLDDLIKDGEPYLTKINNFYAFQQDYFMKNNPAKKLHITMAYKSGREFTFKELDFLKYIKMDEFIKKEDLKVHFWNCNSINPGDWKLLE